MKKFGAFCILAAALLAAACSDLTDYPAGNPRTAATPLRPKLAPRYAFRCENGRAFTFTPVRGRTNLTFPDTPEVEILDDNRIARGTEYANMHYILNEHAGVITLTDLTEERPRPVRCTRG